METERIWMFSATKRGVEESAREKYAKRRQPNAGIMVATVMAICRVFQGGVWKSRMAFWQNFPPKYATKAVMNQGRNKYAPVSDTEKPKLPCM